MYLNIGKDYIVKSKEIIAIFNIDYVKNTKEYKAMYNELEESGNIVKVSDSKAKAFILTENQGKRKAYITNIGVNTISKRMI